MSRSFRFGGWILGLGVAWNLAGASCVRADFVVFSTPSGSTVAGGAVASTATLTTLGNGNLQVVLTNNLATLIPAQVLNSILFNVSGANPTLALVSGAASPGSTVYTSSSTSSTSVDLTPGYGVTNTSGTAGGFSYGHGLGSSGEGGIFAGLGNESYGIVGPGTDLTANSFGNKFPLVESLTASPSSATFVLSGFGNLDASQIVSLAFVYGSAPNGIITAQPVPTPEPASALSTVVGLSLAGFGAWRRRKTRSAA